MRTIWNVPAWEEDDADRPPDMPPRYAIRNACMAIKNSWSDEEAADRLYTATGVMDPYAVRLKVIKDPRDSIRTVEHDTQFNGGGENCRPDNEWWEDQIGMRHG